MPDASKGARGVKSVNAKKKAESSYETFLTSKVEKTDVYIGGFQTTFINEFLGVIPSAGKDDRLNLLLSTLPYVPKTEKRRAVDVETVDEKENAPKFVIKDRCFSSDTKNLVINAYERKEFSYREVLATISKHEYAPGITPLYLGALIFGHISANLHDFKFKTLDEFVIWWKNIFRLLFHIFKLKCVPLSTLNAAIKEYNSSVKIKKSKLDELEEKNYQLLALPFDNINTYSTLLSYIEDGHRALYFSFKFVDDLKETAAKLFDVFACKPNAIDAASTFFNFSTERLDMGKKLLESLKEHKDANQGKDDFMKANYELIDRYTKGRHLGDIKRVGILQRLKKNEVAGPSGHNSNLRLSGTSIHAKDVKTSETANSEIVDEEEEVVAPGNLPYGFVECYGEGCLSGNEFINGKLNTEDGSFFKISEKEYNDLPAVYTWFCPDHREKPDETSVNNSTSNLYGIRTLAKGSSKPSNKQESDDETTSIPSASGSCLSSISTSELHSSDRDEIISNSNCYELLDDIQIKRYLLACESKFIGDTHNALTHLAACEYSIKTALENIDLPDSLPMKCIHHDLGIWNNEEMKTFIKFILNTPQTPPFLRSPDQWSKDLGKWIERIKINFPNKTRVNCSNFYYTLKSAGLSFQKQKIIKTSKFSKLTSMPPCENCVNKLWKKCKKQQKVVNLCALCKLYLDLYGKQRPNAHAFSESFDLSSCLQKK